MVFLSAATQGYLHWPSQNHGRLLMGVPPEALQIQVPRDEPEGGDRFAELSLEVLFGPRVRRALAFSLGEEVPRAREHVDGVGGENAVPRRSAGAPVDAVDLRRLQTAARLPDPIRDVLAAASRPRRIRRGGLRGGRHTGAKLSMRRTTARTSRGEKNGIGNMQMAPEADLGGLPAAP